MITLNRKHNFEGDGFVDLEGDYSNTGATAHGNETRNDGLEESLKEGGERIFTPSRAYRFKRTSLLHKTWLTVLEYYPYKNHQHKLGRNSTKQPIKKPRKKLCFHTILEAKKACLEHVI